MTRSLDRCECQVGRFVTYATRTRGSLRVKYLRCRSCGATSKEIAAVDDLGRTVLKSCTNASTGTATIVVATR